MRYTLALLLVPSLVMATGTKHSHRGPVHSSKEAKAIAEQDTGGLAVSARRVPLNGASCGWEVDVHMPKEDRGWRCIIDADAHMVFTKDRIPNPKALHHKQ